jgi:hypothetical protein
MEVLLAQDLTRAVAAVPVKQEIPTELDMAGMARHLQ